MLHTYIRWILLSSISVFIELFLQFLLNFNDKITNVSKKSLLQPRYIVAVSLWRLLHSKLRRSISWIFLTMTSQHLLDQHQPDRWIHIALLWSIVSAVLGCSRVAWRRQFRSSVIHSSHPDQTHKITTAFFFCQLKTSLLPLS